MKKLNQAFSKMLAVLGVIAILVTAMPSAVYAQARNPRDPATNLPMNPQFIGGKACRLDNNSAGVKYTQCVANASGVLYSLCAYGTVVAAGAGAMAFDSAVVSSIGNLGTGNAISPIVFGTNQIGAGNLANLALSSYCWTPPIPVRFETGLGIVNGDPSVDVLAIYRLDTGINP